MKIKPHQYQHYANGIARIKQCIQNCKEPATVRGTVFSGWNSQDEFMELIDGMGFNLTKLKMDRIKRNVDNIYSKLI